MKTRIITFVTAALLLLTSSCNDSLTPLVPGNQEITEITAYADNGGITKTGLVDNGSGGKNVVWKSGNAISLFFVSGNNGGDKFTTSTNGPVAKFIGTITAVTGDLSDSGGSAYFWATYPYNDAASCDGTGITTSLTAKQKAYVNDVADDLLVTVGRSTNPAIYFRNTCTIIEFKLSQANISKITFRGNNDENVAGEFKASFDANNKVVHTATGNAVKSIEITPAESATFAVDTKYYFAFLPGTFSKGYTLVFTRNDGYEATYTKSTASNFVVGTFYTMTNKDSGLNFIPQPLKFTSTGATNISLTKSGSPDDISLEYKVDDGEWTSYIIGDAVALTDGQELSFRAGASGNASFSKSTNSYYTFSVSGSGTVAASGNIMSLLNREAGLTIPISYCFYRLFSRCYHRITTAPALPATTLASGCYNRMFYGCTSLTTAPELPATTLEESCYYMMFYGCTSLTTAPELPATTLAYACYGHMFYGCTSLKTVPEELHATTLASACCSNMFYGCTSLTTAPALPATTLASDCYNMMFYGCTSLTTAPKLPATTLAYACYGFMFEGCTSLTTAPELPATTLANGCYEYMFRECTSLTTVPEELPATTLAYSCYWGMFQECTSLTTAPTLPATTLAASCYYAMFAYCNNLTIAPTLPATTLTESCYEFMFAYCNNLTTAPTLPATTLAERCYAYMFAYCNNLTTAPTLPATTLAEGCYDSMFQYCTSLTTAPTLPATTLAASCYAWMFYNCTSLYYVKALFTTTPSNTYTENWLKNVYATGTFVKSRSATWYVTGANGVPSGWTIITE